MELFEGDYEYFSWKLEQKEAYESLESHEQASAKQDGRKQAPLERKGIQPHEEQDAEPAQATGGTS